jgi:ActR/RegA family two-component response regulator
LLSSPVGLEIRETDIPEGMAPLGNAVAVSEGTDPRMLIVDDEASILFAMSEYFTVRGYVVDCAGDPDAAAVLLGRHAYEVVVADLRLSVTRDEEGFDVIDSVHDRCPSARTILLTAYGSPAIEVEARRRGVDAVLLKPQPLAEIARIVESLLARER